jgi:hypothetical protein
MLSSMTNWSMYSGQTNSNFPSNLNFVSHYWPTRRWSLHRIRKQPRIRNTHNQAHKPCRSYRIVQQHGRSSQILDNSSVRNDFNLPQRNSRTTRMGTRLCK